MQASFSIGFVVAALLIAAGAPPVAADPVCADPCTINASSNLPDAPGYDPAVAIIENGTSLVWHSLDGKTHPHVEVNLGSDCLGVSSSSGSDSPSVVFEIWNGSLRTTVGSTVTTCASATGVAQGGFTFTYRCLLHLNMNGAVVVLADA